MFSRLPIKVTAPLLVGAPVLVVGVWLSVMWNHQSRNAVSQLADNNIELVHEMAANRIADVLSVPVRICKVNEHLVASRVLDPGELNAWRPTFVRQAKAFDALSAITWGDAEGRGLWISRYADGAYYWAVKTDPSNPKMTEWRLNDDETISEEPSSEFDFDLFTRPWFKTPRDAGKPTWSEPYVWLGGAESEGMTLGISYGIPMYEDDGDLLGIIDADFSLNDLSGFLQSIQIGETGVAALIARDGKLIAVSNDSPIIDADGKRVSASDSPDALIVAAATFVGDKETKDETNTVVQLDGSPHYLRASPIGQAVGLDWTLVTIIPESDFTAEIETEFQRSWAASLVAVVVAVALGLVAARWLVAPLIKLVTAVRRIGQGDLDTHVQIRHAPEYTNLGDEINEMTLGLKDRLRMRESLSLAMEVQKNLLPSEAPTIQGLDIAGHSTYCDETGGDYYDFLDVSGSDENTAVIVVGDVMGHGVAAAMLMATARGILRSRCAVPGSLGDFLEHLNDMLVPDTRGQRFMTMLLVTVSASRQELHWSSAGHGPPIIYDANSDTFSEIDGGGLPLGIMEGEDYEEHVETGVKPGCLILAATDGLWETMGQDGDIFGMDRLRELLREHANRPAAEISDTLRDTLAQFRGPAAQDDDLTFVIAKVV